MHVFDAKEPDRNAKRSHGVLTPRQVQAFRASGVSLAYDPVQIGWVVDDDSDDMADLKRGNGLATHAGIALRPWAREDAVTLAGMLSDPGLWRYLPDPYMGPMSPASARALIDVANQSDHHSVRAITRNGRPVGQVRLEFGKCDTGAAELSYWIGQDHRGQGIVHTAVSKWLAKPESGTARALYVLIHQDNPASLTIARKLGFVTSGQDGPWIRMDRRP